MTDGRPTLRSEIERTITGLRSRHVGQSDPVGHHGHKRLGGHDETASIRRGRSAEISERRNVIVGCRAMVAAGSGSNTDSPKRRHHRRNHRRSSRQTMIRERVIYGIAVIATVMALSSCITARVIDQAERARAVQELRR